VAGGKEGRADGTRFALWYTQTMNDEARRRRAVSRKARATLVKTTLGVEADCTPIVGADAISLATRLTRESWILAGIAIPAYSRKRVPCRFVPNQP
jgi:hypothetical protein